MPIDIASGVVTLEYEDVTIPGYVPLVWDRHYSTARGQHPASPLGRGWTCRYFSTLAVSGGEYVFTTPDGSTEVLFDEDGVVPSGGVIRHFGASLEIFRAGKRFIVQRWDLESHDVWRYCYDAGAQGVPWRLSSIEDVAGQGIDLRWDADGRLATIRQRAEHRELLVEYDASGLVQTVSLAAATGRHQIARYEYRRAWPTGCCVRRRRRCRSL